MIRSVIIEDEKASRETLVNYLTKYCPAVEIAGEANSVKTGIKLIRETKPALVFLDVEMPFGNAFDLLEQTSDLKFETIFVTAFSHYAMKALNCSASYYLLKPVDINELVAAVEKVKQELEQGNYAVHTKVLIDNIKTVNNQMHKLVLPVLDGFEVVQVKDIIRCEGNDNLTNFHLADGSKKVICRTLKFYETLLSDFNFVRVHRSHLVNVQYIKKYKKGKGGQVILTDGTEVEVSNAKKEQLMKFF